MITYIPEVLTTDFTSMNQSRLLAFAKYELLPSIIDVKKFPKLQDSVPAITAATDAYIAAFTAARHDDEQLVFEKNEKQKELILELRQLAKVVNVACKGNPGYIFGTCLKPRRKGTKSQQGTTVPTTDIPVDDTDETVEE